MTLPFNDRYVLYQPVVDTTDFLVDFPLFDAGDIEVRVDAQVIQAYSLSATFSGGKADNAVVVLDAAVNGVDVEIYGRRVPRRDNQYLSNSSDLVEKIEQDVEAITAVQQEQRRDFGNAIKFPSNDAEENILPDAAARSGKVLGFDQSGAVSLVTGLASAPVSAFMEGPVMSNDAAGFLSDLGFSAFMQSLRGSADAAALRGAIGLPASVEVVSADRAIVAADIEKTFVVTASATLTLPAPNSVPNGFSFRVLVNGGGVTVSGQINGSTSLFLVDGMSAEIIGDGAAGYYAIVTDVRGRVIYDYTTPKPFVDNASARWIFSGFDDIYSQYEIEIPYQAIEGIFEDGTDLTFGVSVDNRSSWVPYASTTYQQSINGGALSAPATGAPDLMGGAVSNGFYGQHVQATITLKTPRSSSQLDFEVECFTDIGAAGNYSQRVKTIGHITLPSAKVTDINVIDTRGDKTLPDMITQGARAYVRAF